ncbi:MAG: peptidoglycan DD-metalloendopeptidase family protein [Bacteroidota bacterium]|nr:peptidoglycan DD-metalloendopeptidase family protein [Bacteroidota bacterium]
MMRLKQWCTVLVLMVTLQHVISASQQTDIKRKDRQLQRLRAEIEQYEQQIQESEKKEKATLDRLDKIEQKTNLLRTLLSELHGEENLIRQSIDSTQLTITLMEKQLAYLRSHYAGYVASVYKYGKVYDVETILSSNSINQLYIRIEYLRRFSDQRKRDLEKIAKKKEQIEFENSTLQEKLSTEQQLISEKIQEENSLNQTKARRKRTLHAIRNDKTQFQKELKRKVTAAHQLENIIATLIEQERVRKEKAERETRERKERLARERAAQRERERAAKLERIRELAELKKKNELEKAKAKEREIELAQQRADEREHEFAVEESQVETPVSSLDDRKGKLMWPVTSGRVVAEFGNHVHPVMKTITTNTGIDISTKDNTPIHSIASGEVALIHWLPSYGNLVIINHSHGYRTVYAHLSDVNVVVGQKIKEGEVIARSGDSVTGDMLHFELWREKEKQNPRDWLARK